MLGPATGVGEALEKHRDAVTGGAGARAVADVCGAGRAVVGQTVGHLRPSTDSPRGRAATPDGRPGPHRHLLHHTRNECLGASADGTAGSRTRGSTLGAHAGGDQPQHVPSARTATTPGPKRSTCTQRRPPTSLPGGLRRCLRRRTGRHLSQLTAPPAVSGFTHRSLPAPPLLRLVPSWPPSRLSSPA